MLGKWVRFDNKIPVDGIWWAQESPHSEDIGVQDECYSQPPESRKSEHRAFARFRGVRIDDDSMTVGKPPNAQEGFC